MIAAVWLAGLAWADPVALRGPTPAWAGTVGAHELSLGAPVGPVEVALEAGASGAAFGASVGRRAVLVGRERTWRLTAGIAGGLSVPALSPGLAVTATPWIAAGALGGRGTFRVLAASPAALQVIGGVEARVPALVELETGVRIGAGGEPRGLWVVGRLGLGPVFAPGTDVSTFLEPALYLGWVGGGSDAE